jgi:hypothetical protein
MIVSKKTYGELRTNRKITNEEYKILIKASEILDEQAEEIKNILEKKEEEG